MNKTNIISIEIILYFFLMIVFITSESTGESIEGYHIVKGTPYTYISDNKYIFRNTPDDLPFIIEFPMNELKNDPEIVKIERGASAGRVVFEVFIKTEEKTEVVWLQYWIHTSVSEAEEALIERFNSPLGRFNAIDIGLEGEIGDNCWYSDYFIDFVRNNVQVCVCTDWTPPLPEFIIKVSKKVDALLMETEKINDASLIAAPVIESVENIPGEFQRETSLQLKVNALEPNDQNLIYWLSFHHKISYDGILKMTFGEAGSKTFKIWAMNEDRIVSSKEVTFLIPSAVAVEGTTPEAPHPFTLNQNAPNPFNPGTAIGYELTQPGQVSLRIYDLLGREVAVLVDGMKDAGHHEAYWNGRDTTGNPVASGVYLYRLETGGQVETRRMMLVR